MNTDDIIMTVILTSAVVATVALIWIRKNVPPDLPPKEAIAFALKKLSYQSSDKIASAKREERGGKPPSTPPQPPPPPVKDQPSVGGSYTGGFGSGLPFLDALPGMGEPQPVTITDITFNVSYQSLSVYA